MIATASQALATLFTQQLSRIAQEQILFEHPRLWQRQQPGLNLYCDHVQATDLDHNPTFRFVYRFL
jgi:hypothetical protein